MTLIRSAALTDIGRVRKNNEDRYLHDETAMLFGVADGVEVPDWGGAAAGAAPASAAPDGVVPDGAPVGVEAGVAVGAAAGVMSAGTEDGDTRVGEAVGGTAGPGPDQDSVSAGDRAGATHRPITEGTIAPMVMAMAADTLTPMALHPS